MKKYKMKNGTKDIYIKLYEESEGSLFYSETRDEFVFDKHDTKFKRSYISKDSIMFWSFMILFSLSLLFYISIKEYMHAALSFVFILNVIVNEILLDVYKAKCMIKLALILTLKSKDVE